MTHFFAALVCACAIASPLAAEAQPASETRPLLEEPTFLTRMLSWTDDFGGDGQGQTKDGFYPDLGHMITGAGWISVGPGYRHHLFRGHALVDVSAAISWRAYKIAQARFELPYLAHDRVVVGSQVLWHDYTQVRYFGVGADTLETGASDYRLRAADVVGYATWRPRRALDVSGAVGWLARPRLSASAGSFDRDEPDTLQLYADDPAAQFSRQPRFAHTALSVTADTRDHAGYATRGALLHGSWATYHDRPAGTSAFARYEGEAAAFLPLLRRGVIAARFWGVFTDTADGREVPFYLLPSLGGHNTLRGYADYRFHDRHLVVANLESRWALFEHIDTAVFFDAGSVAARADALNFDRTSYGLGMRLHSNRSTLARLDVAHSEEGWRIHFKLTDALRLGRLAKRTAALPFVP